VKIVLCPTKCVVASYLFSSAKTDAILGVHIHNEVCVFSKERHLAFRIPTISAVCVGLDELPYSEAICGFLGGDGDVFAH
jgi:hypothetical protein